jgi:cytochrome c oxidase cbb3-type subunit III
VADQRDTDAFSGVETTGHSWDGIKELDNPLPRWWLWVWIVCIIWAIGYWIAMPAWPLVSGYTKGVLGYSQRATVTRQIAEAREAQSALRSRIAAASLVEIRSDPELLEFALAGGKSAFAVNCSQCHGSGAAGAKGFPNLNDDVWLWGGRLKDIEQSISFGIRADHEETRLGDMPAFLRDETLTRAQIGDVAEYVLSLSGRAEDAAAAKRGAPVFAENCAACHKDDGTGNREVGAPDLRDAIWLYGGDRKTIVKTVSQGRRGVMPAWEGRLDAVLRKQLAVYVHSLGGGE